MKISRIIQFRIVKEKIKIFYILNGILLSIILSFVAFNSSYATTDYSNSFKIDNELCYSVTNYYNKNFTKKCYPTSWTSLFAQDGSYDRSYFEAEKTSFLNTIKNGKGSWAVINQNRDTGDNSGNPYFLYIVWVEDNSNGASKIKFQSDGSGIYLDSGGNVTHSATISSAQMVQGGGALTPSYLWGSSSGESFTLSGAGSDRLFQSTFPVDYPTGYNGVPLPAMGPAVPYSPAIDYSNSFKIDKELCYSVTNYYNLNFPKECYSTSWASLFIQDGYYDRNYFEAEKTSFLNAVSSGNGAWAVVNSNNDKGDNTSNPYFIELIWVEDNSNGKSKIKFDYDGTMIYLDSGGNTVHAATIASAQMVQGGGALEPSYLWGSSSGGGFAVPGGGSSGLFLSTFPVDYPEYYNGIPTPAIAPTSNQLNYLALGDSISSGEGDTALNPAINKKYYRQNTDIEENKPNGQPREKCHLSMRSYPYLLASWMNISNNPAEWDSVACSGAKTSDIYASGYGFVYAGQPKGGLLGAPLGDAETPRLEGYNNKNQLQAEALNERIPGRVEQIKFVEKYQPKVITLTAGANDIDFASKLQNCLLPNQLGIPYTCAWATTKKSSLAGQIQNQYDRLVSLYKELYRASNGEAKIYALGYPNLINGETAAQCLPNIGSLDNEERKMIVDATNYLNVVIEHAANAAGVKYIDVSSALSGGRLCDDEQEYVTGLAMRGESEIQESFHPNDFGHIKITQTLKEKVDNQSLIEYDVCADTSAEEDINCPKEGELAQKPPVPSEMGGVAINSRVVEAVAKTVTKSSEESMRILDHTFRPGSTLRRELHSDPIDLGDITININGGVDTSILIPSSTPAGYHTLILTGENYAGEPMELTETILVTGTNSDDMDDNGLPDSQQICGLFIVPSNNDVDYDGIDDACDSQITDPILYTARNGDIAKGEDSSKLYLFRNTRASELTGITNDYIDLSQDQNNKEALVATSLDDETEAVYSKLAMIIDPEDDTKWIPVILSRDTDNTCIALRASSLSVALDSADPNYTPRGFTQLANIPQGLSCDE